MDSKLYISPTDISPEISCDSVELTFVIRGRSMPENSEKFYDPVHKWFRTRFTDTKVKAVVDINLEYYNTGSFIRIMGLFNILYDLNKAGNEFRVRWICDAEDEDNIADGQSFKDVVKIPFDIIEI
jgi:hypothetical protein